MSKRICGRCGSTDIEENSLRGEVIWCNCNRCKYFAKVADFPEQSIFDRITASPEVLAEVLVYESPGYNKDGDKDVFYRSKVDNFWVYTNREEAIAATVEKLKEVEK